MGLSSFKTFQALRKQGHIPSRMGFSSKCSTKEINVFSTRMRLARSFQGLALDGYNPETVLGYGGFFQVFLTHSALECFLRINNLKNVTQLEPLILPYKPEEVIETFFKNDPKLLLFDYLSDHVNKDLKLRLDDVKARSSCNAAYLSASIRHIFAHGHLTAHSNGIKNTKRVHLICQSISNFLINFMDAEFTSKVVAFHTELNLSTNSVAN